MSSTTTVLGGGAAGQATRQAQALGRAWGRLAPRTRFLLTCLALAAVGLALRHSQWTAVPTNGADWPWMSPGRVRTWSPFVWIWDQTWAFHEVRFYQARRFPLLAISGILQQAGLGWGVSEKLVYFWPYAALTGVAPWLLAREITGSNRWALLAPLVLMTAPDFLVESLDHVPTTMAVLLGCLVMVAFFRAMRRRSLKWSLATGLLLGFETFYDIRPAYLTVLVMGLYFLILSGYEWSPKLALRRFGLSLLAGFVFLLTQAFWLLPIATHTGNLHLPIPNAPNFPNITIDFGITGMSTHWTGGAPVLAVAPLNPVYFIIPIVAMIPLLGRRIRPEVAWLLVVALVFAWLASTDNPPVGAIYDWMFLHIPGWRLFREGSKFLEFTVLAEAVLVAISLQALWRRAGRGRFWRSSKAAAALLGIAVFAVAAYSAGPLLEQRLGQSDNPTPVPSSLDQISNLVDSPDHPGLALWLGGKPTLNPGGPGPLHHFLIGSTTHPMLPLTGQQAGKPSDPLQQYCANPNVPFCYLEPDLFRWLVGRLRASYVFSPADQRLGEPLIGVTRTWLKDQASAVLGPPTLIGSGHDAMYFWRVPTVRPEVSRAAAVALVHGGAWMTNAGLPAISALGLPVAYRDTLDRVNTPAAPSAPPDSIDVLPRQNSGCFSPLAGSFAVMARSSAPSLQVGAAGVPANIPLLNASSAMPGWGFYGPVHLARGFSPVESAQAALGPCVAWSGLTQQVLRGGVVQPASTTVSDAERVTANSGSGGPWVELVRTYDQGWEMKGGSNHLMANGLSNMYYAGANRGRAVFSYSSARWELIGQVISATGIALSVFLIGVLVARERKRTVAAPEPFVESPAREQWVARLLAGGGFIMLLLAAANAVSAWFAAPSARPELFVAPDPYGLTVGYATAAVALFGASLAVRVVTAALGDRLPRMRRRGVPAAAGVTAVVLLLSSCGDLSNPSNASALLDEARQQLLAQGPDLCIGDYSDAQAAFPFTSCTDLTTPNSTGNLLDDARLQLRGRQPDLCIGDYSKALTVFPKLIEALTGRGFCYETIGRNPAAAARDYTRAISLTPTDASLYLRRAGTLVSTGDFAGARADLLMAASVPSVQARQVVLAIDGLASLDLGPDARAVYAQAAQQFSTSAVIHIGGADAARAVGRESEAAHEMDVAAQIADLPSTKAADRAFVYTRRGHFVLVRHQWQAVIANDKIAAATDPSAWQALSDSALALMQTGQTAAGLSKANLALETYVGQVSPDAQTAGVSGPILAGLLEIRAWGEIYEHRPDTSIGDLNRAITALRNRFPDTRDRLLLESASAAGGERY